MESGKIALNSNDCIALDHLFAFDVTNCIRADHPWREADPSSAAAAFYPTH